ncbi:MAG: hypothetical protein WA775_00955 [Psychroserpens sp.]|uniref:hypothetical protein n=1 Tax=Psychroserpens sp. TaxID=2020870 RepID=UPI003C779851
MRKLFFVLAFSLVGTFAFANVELNNVETKENDNIETLVDGYVIDYEIIVDEFDICTVTVTITRADGRRFSATASNNQGNCNAAADAAEDEARVLAAVLE